MPGALERSKQVVIDFDELVDQRVDRVRGHRGLDKLMYGASEIGDWSLLWHVVGTGQALLPGRDPMTAVRLSALLGVESLLVNGAIKSLFQRHRPVWEEDRPRPHRVRTPRSSSFPSGHASSAFAAAVVLGQGDPLWHFLIPIDCWQCWVVYQNRQIQRVHQRVS